MARSTTSLSLALFTVAVLALLAAPAMGQDSGGDDVDKSLDQGGSHPPAEEDTSVYGPAKTVVAARERGTSINGFLAGAFTLSNVGSLEFDGEVDTDGDDVEEAGLDYKAEGDWMIGLVRWGIRFEFGKQSFKFRLGLFGQRIWARFESDGATEVDWTTHPVYGTTTLTDQTVVDSLHLSAGGGLELGFNVFIKVLRLAVNQEGIANVLGGPVIGFAIHLSGCYDDETAVAGGYGGLDLSAGWKFQFINRITLFFELGGLGGVLVAGGGEFPLLMAYGVLWRALIGVGIAL